MEKKYLILFNFEGGKTNNMRIGLLKQESSDINNMYDMYRLFKEDNGNIKKIDDSIYEIKSLLSHTKENIKSLVEKAYVITNYDNFKFLSVACMDDMSCIEWYTMHELKAILGDKKKFLKLEYNILDWIIRNLIACNLLDHNTLCKLDNRIEQSISYINSDNSKNKDILFVDYNKSEDPKNQVISIGLRCDTELNCDGKIINNYRLMKTKDKEVIMPGNNTIRIASDMNNLFPVPNKEQNKIVYTDADILFENDDIIIAKQTSRNIKFVDKFTKISENNLDIILYGDYSRFEDSLGILKYILKNKSSFKYDIVEGRFESLVYKIVNYKDNEDIQELPNMEHVDNLVKEMSSEAIQILQDDPNAIVIPTPVNAEQELKNTIDEIDSIKQGIDNSILKTIDDINALKIIDTKNIQDMKLLSSVSDTLAHSLRTLIETGMIYSKNKDKENKDSFR